MEALRATLVAALTTMSVMRIVVVLATGQFSLLALKMILLAAPAVLGTSWLLRRYPPLATRDGAQDRVRVASRHRRQHRRLSPAGTLSPHA